MIKYYIKILFDKLKNLAIYIAIIFLCFSIIYYPKASANGVSEGINICVGTLIPSLYPYMIISIFIINSGIAEKIGIFISPITKFLFNLPGYTGATFLLGLIGGYPVGPKGIKTLLNKRLIDYEQANRMLLFSVGAGPVFTINVIGKLLLNNEFLGIIIFFTQIALSLIIGIILGILSKKKSKNSTSTTKNIEIKNINISKSIVDACSQATDSMITMCSFVIISSALISILKNFGIEKTLSTTFLDIGISQPYSDTFLQILLEITKGCINAKNITSGYHPEIFAFAVGWAGICIHLQIIAIINSKRFDYKKFALIRLLYGIISSLIILLSMNYIKPSVPAFSNIQKIPIASTSKDLLSGMSLIFLIICFLNTIKIANKQENRPVIK